MALTDLTYSGLQATIKDWLSRSDLDSRIIDYIVICESRMNRRLRTYHQEIRSTSSISSKYLTLPDDFLEMRSIQTTTALGQQLKYVSPDMFNRMYKTTDTGEPQYFTITDGNIGIAPAPDGTWTLEIIYYQKIPSLSATNTTNWVLTNYPDVYLYGSLVAAEGQLKNDTRIPVWKTQFEEGLHEIEGADHRWKYPGMAMSIRPA